MVNNWELPGTQKVVAEVAPIFVQFIKELFFNNIGFETGVLVCDVKSSYKPQSFDEEAAPRGDRFRVLIPYGGRFVKWEVIFDWYHQDRAPDFLFSDDFMQKLDRLMVQDKDFLTTWANWDHKEPKSLLYILRTLLDKYKEYQVSRLEDGSRTKGEFELLVSSTGLAPSTVEVLGGPGDSIRKARPNDKRTVTFLIRLPVNFSEYLGPVADGEEDNAWVMLFVEFSHSSDPLPNIELRFSPLANQVLHAVSAPRKSALSSLAVHAAVAKATLWLREALARIGAARQNRCELLTTLARKLHPGLIEMDTKQFLSASFLLKREDFQVVMSVALSQHSTGQKPVIHFRSIYQMDPDSEPLSKVMEDFPYANSWSPEEKANRILNFCFDRVPEFRKECEASTEMGLD